MKDKNSNMSIINIWNEFVYWPRSGKVVSLFILLESCAFLLEANTRGVHPAGIDGMIS